ncbi:uncharacterized protein RJT20DRAFT_141303 [Scheffersomyces xylosifermentans]|uniref:uncharacterized protein n=1 Tax=Scheffersomyces xylosifermentans TaxID=1304137 RepID=UPI00315D68B1
MSAQDNKEVDEETKNGEELPNYTPNSKVTRKFIIANNKFDENLLVFISRDSAELYRTFKKRDGDPSNPAVVAARRHNQKEKILKKYLTIYKYDIDKEKLISDGFDDEKDVYEYCEITKKVHINHITFEKKFTPLRNDRSQDFELVVFVHSVLPLCDYVHNGQRHRWVQEKHSSGKLNDYTHVLLSPEKHSLTDNWDKATNKIEKSVDPDNPLIGGYLKRAFSIGSTRVKDEYYSANKLGILDHKDDHLLEYLQRFSRYTMEDVLDDQPVSIEIDSVSSEALTRLCIASLLKREEDILNNNFNTKVAYTNY